MPKSLEIHLYSIPPIVLSRNSLNSPFTKRRTTLDFPTAVSPSNTSLKVLGLFQPVPGGFLRPLDVEAMVLWTHQYAYYLFECDKSSGGYVSWTTCSSMQTLHCRNLVGRRENEVAVSYKFYYENTINTYHQLEMWDRQKKKIKSLFRFHGSSDQKYVILHSENKQYSGMDRDWKEKFCPSPSPYSQDLVWHCTHDTNCLFLDISKRKTISWHMRVNLSYASKL